MGRGIAHWVLPAVASKYLIYGEYPRRAIDDANQASTAICCSAPPPFSHGLAKGKVF